MELTLDQALQKGVEAHKAGKAQEADRYYTAILKAQPKHPDANHNMGVLAVGVGKAQQALPFFKKALETNPDIAQFWLSYIDALIKLDQPDEAKAMLDKAKSNGAKGDGLDKLQEQLGLSSNKTSNAQEPTKEQIQHLIGLYGKGQYQKAVNGSSHLLIEFPHYFILYNLIGAANQALGKLEEAIKAYKKAISIKPDFADAHNNMGNALKEQGKLDKAIEAYNKALLINPSLAEAHNNMGNALKEQGELDKAIEAFSKALLINADYAEAFNNKGTVFQEQGDLKKAMEAYNKAISIKTDYAEAHNNMGNVLRELGKLDQAIEAYSKALSIKPDFAVAYHNLGVALKAFTFTDPNKTLQKTIASLLDQEKCFRPKDIATAAISLLKLEPNLRQHLQLVNTKIIENPIDCISDLYELPLLLKLMSICPLPDLELEQLFKNLRYSILSNISSLTEASPKLIRVLSALALQCFTNEYIYNCTDKEKKALRALEKKVENTLLNKEQPNPKYLLTIACYKALNQYDWCNLLVATDHIQEVFSRQVEEPNEEEKLKQDLPILEEITNSVSSKVKKQYEDSPYPRWVNLGLALNPMSISKVASEIKLKLYDNKITEVEQPDILIAGCGTGQHSIATASRFRSSKVLAIDLSLSSLAYAKRKTKELGIENISYMQADILDLKQLNKKFDVIESAGVLHHMENPLVGWKVLTDCLTLGGLMRIGLYSELARQHIAKIRDEIGKTVSGSSDAAMKSFRTMLITSNYTHHERATHSQDFYSLSTFQDLLFHVQEYRFTISQIKDHLDELGLKFCGFETRPVVSHFTENNTAKGDPYNLDKWQAYEEANPRAFTGMYQFWCQKINGD